MGRRSLGLVMAAVLAGSGSAFGQATTGQPGAGGQAAPALRVPTVVLERSEILAGESVAVRLVFADPTAPPPVTQLCVQLLGPSFLTLEGPQPDPSGSPCAPKALGPFRVDGPLQFSLRAGSQLREGKVTVVFDLAFDEGRTRRVGVEKILDVGVLGIGSISGVPLQLAVLILPGVAALGVARVLGVAWVGSLQTLETAALAFGISAILASCFDLLVSVPSSALRVLLLIGIGAILGGAFRIASSRAKQREAKAAAAALEAATVSERDELGPAVAKALRLNAAQLDPSLSTVVRLQDGRQFEGSLSAPTRTGGLAILGWCRVEASTGAKADMDRAIAGGDWNTLGARLASALAAKEARVELLERVRVYDSQQQPVDPARAAILRVEADDVLEQARTKARRTDFGQLPFRTVDPMK